MRRTPASLALLTVLLLVSPGRAHAPDERVRALAPLEVVARGFLEPVGVVLDGSGSLHVADRRRGIVSRVLPDGRAVIVARLFRPCGLAADGEGRLLVVEEGRGRLLRREHSGALSVLAGGLHRPCWAAAGPDGSVYVSARDVREERAGGWRGVADAREEDDDRGAGDVVVRVDPVTGAEVVARGLHGVRGLAVDGGVLIAAVERLHGEGERQGAVLVRFPILPDGRLGPAEVLGRGEVREAAGVAVDRLGAVFVAVERRPRQGEHGPWHGRHGAIEKWSGAGAVTTFALGLDEVGGLAFDGDGHLYVAERGEGRGRVLRFRAPVPPRVEAPAFTQHSPVPVAGEAEPGAMVAAYAGDDLSAPLAVGAAWPESGRFDIAVPVRRNGANPLEVVATGASGAGLAGAPTRVSVVHDDIAPRVAMLVPPPGAVVRGQVALRAHGADEGSGVATVSFTIDGRVVGTVAGGDQPQSVTATVVLDTSGLSDGIHALGALAADRAGNSAAVSQALVVDNNPPETEIAEGPNGETGDTTAVFILSGADNLTPASALLYSWRMDGGPWSPFAPGTRVAAEGLAPGPHVFEAKARDEAGNEDPSPARREFVVSVLAVRIADPSDGAALEPGVRVVRGTVQAGGREVGVTVNGVQAAVHGTSFSAAVPVGPETTTLSATATVAGGATVTHRISVTPLPGLAEAAVLLASPARGTAPLTVAFSVAGLDPATPTTLELDADGDGRVDLTGSRLGGASFTYTQPGLYVPTLAMVDHQGGRKTVATVVLVEDAGLLDRHLRARWTGLKDALRRADIAGALREIVGPARPGYEAIFRALSADLPQVDSILTDLFLVEVRGVDAIYEMVRTDDGVVKSFEVRFTVDEDGIRRLRAF